MDFKDHRDFFEKNGERYLQPVAWGECLYPVDVEEMYQHFKARMLEELKVQVVGEQGVLRDLSI